MNLFIDADTGTYGIADNVYILRVNDDANIADLLDSMTDEDRATLAVAFGIKALDMLY